MKYQTLADLQSLSDEDILKLKGEQIEEIKKLYGDANFRKYCTHEGRRKTQLEAANLENREKAAEKQLEALKKGIKPQLAFVNDEPKAKAKEEKSAPLAKKEEAPKETPKAEKEAKTKE